MEHGRSKKARLNGVVSLAHHLALLACGFIVPRLLIGAFGSEAYGATVSISQFLGIIVLFEGGIGGVARAALYKFLAENDVDGVSAVVIEIRKIFRIVGCIFLAYVLVLSCTFKFISHIECLDWFASFLLVISISVSTFGHYFVGLPNIVLLRASQKLYISEVVSIITVVLNAVCVVALVYIGCNLIVVKLVSSFVFLLRPALVHLYVKRTFSIVGSPKKEGVLQQKRNGMAQQIAHYVSLNAGTIVLTCFVGLVPVAVYAVYSMILSHMQNLICSCMAGLEALFGDMLAKNETEQLNRSFEDSEALVSMVAVPLLAVTAVLIVPFVGLYTAGINDVDYLAPLLAQLLVLSSLLYCLRVPYHYLIISAGHFAQTQVACVGEAVINVLLSMLLVNTVGITGVAVAVLVGTTFRFAYYVVYLSNNILHRSVSLFIKRSVVNAIAFAAALAAGSSIVCFAYVGTCLSWVVCAVVALGSVVPIVFGVNALIYRNEVAAAVRKMTLSRNAGK